MQNEHNEYSYDQRTDPNHGRDALIKAIRHKIETTDWTAESKAHNSRLEVKYKTDYTDEELNDWENSIDSPVYDDAEFKNTTRMSTDSYMSKIRLFDHRVSMYAISRGIKFSEVDEDVKNLVWSQVFHPIF